MVKVGREIPAQILESVRKSEKTLIVLSEAYVRADWTKMEFRVAHMQASKKNKRVEPIIFIFTSDYY